MLRNSPPFRCITFFYFYRSLIIYLFFKLINLFILLSNIELVLPYIDMNMPRMCMCSPFWIPLPPSSPSHPSGSSQCTSPKHPVSCMKPGLVIHFIYDNLHVSMPFSHIIPPCPLPQSPKDCSIHLCLFYCLAYRVIIAAKSRQSCPTPCDPIDGSPPGSPVPGILQARTLEWVAISFSSAWKWKVTVKSLSRVRLFATPWTAAYQSPLSMGFSRREYWSGVPWPSLRVIVTIFINSIYMR